MRQIPAAPKWRLYWHFVRYVLQRFSDGQGFLNVSALTYTTLFAVVPVTMVIYSMLSVLPAFQGVTLQLQDFVFSHFLPSSSRAVQQYLAGFTEQARKLTAVGVAFLVVTAYLMLRTIEQAFNRIWGVNKSRSGLSSFLLYWAVLSLGPLLLGAAFVISSYLATLPLLSDVGLVGGSRILLVLPMVLSILAFTMLYWAVPNCPVPIRHAFYGGLLAAVLFNGAKAGFTLYVTRFPSYQLIYGAFAAIPLFLFWIYISWFVIILGAFWVRAVATFGHREPHAPGDMTYYAFALLNVLWQRQRVGKVSAEAEIQSGLAMSSEQLEQLLSALRKAMIVTRHETGGWLLLRDIHELTIFEVVRCMPHMPQPCELGRDLPQWGVLLREQLLHVEGYSEQALSMSVSELLNIADKHISQDMNGTSESGKRNSS